MHRLTFLAALIAVAAPTAASAQDFAPSDAVAESYRLSNPSRADFVSARTELEAGRYETAAHLYDRLADGTGNQNVRLLAGFANLGAGRIERAEVHFERSLELDHRSAFARLGLGMVAISRGDRSVASEQLESLNQARARCDGTCRQADEIEQAAASLRRAIG